VHIRFMMAGAVMSVLSVLSVAGDEAAELNPPEAASPPPSDAPAPAAAAPDSAAPAPATPVPGDAQPALSKEIVELQDVHALLGKEVRSSKGEPMGRIVNVLIDGAGKPRAAVIDFGGFLGVGVRKIAVDWSALQFSPYQDYERIAVALTRDDVKRAPEFKDEQRVLAVGVSGAATGP
jgi:PRC-barrel domain